MSYGVKVEISGEYALFSRPELKVERVSYEVITPSAARGILEAVLWKPAIRYVIDQIDVCAPIRFENIRRNEVNSKASYGGQKLQSGLPYQSASEDRAQRASTVLRHVRYVVTSHFDMTEKAGPADTAEKFTAMLHRRLENGQRFHTPYLGTREFPANIRLIAEGEEAPAPIPETRSLGFMLYDIDFVKVPGEDGRENVVAFEPMYFMARMNNGVIDLRGAEVLK